MNITSDLLHESAARGEDIPAHMVLAVAQRMEKLEDELRHTKSRLEQKSTQVSLMLSINHMALESAAGCRTVEAMREEVLSPGTKRDTQLYNAFEVRQCIYALDHAEEAYAALKVAYDQIDVESAPARSVKKILDALNNNLIGPFSFKEVTEVVEYFRPQVNQVARKPCNNVFETLRLLKARPNEIFHGEEARMLRQWGQDHERNCNTLKAKLGRAFTDPVGYMDTRFDLMLTRGQKRELLDERIISTQGYQNAVFARPDFLLIPDDWRIGNDGQQFHAGETWHTDPAGLWWTATLHQRLTPKELMTHLETALAELRLLYVHFPNGVTNEEPVK